MRLTDERRLLQDTAGAFAQKELAPNAAAWDRAAQFPAAAVAALGRLGFMGMLVPPEHGGDGETSTILSVDALCCGAIVQYGSDEQKRRFLRPRRSVHEDRDRGHRAAAREPMRRRTILAALVGLSVARPGIVRAQQPRSIAYMSPGPRRPDTTGAFLAELARRGYAEGRNLTVFFYDFLAEPAAADARAQEFVRAGVDAIVVDGPEAPMRAAYKATRAVPIVVVAVNYDPVERGYAASLSRPGGNVTGIFLRSIELAAKQVELLKTLIPDTARLTVLWAPETEDEFRAVAAGAAGLGVELRSAPIGPPPYDIDAMFRGLAGGAPHPVLVLSPPTFALHRPAIAAAALRYRVPAIFRFRAYVDAGGLMSYGVNRPAMSQRAAIFVGKILGGAKPAELPIERADKFELVINLKTANALGLAVPHEHSLCDE